MSEVSLLQRWRSQAHIATRILRYDSGRGGRYTVRMHSAHKPDRRRLS